MDESLTTFVREALARGIAKPEIECQLLDAGWPADEIRTSLAAWADSEFAVPVPRPKPYLSPREALVYLVLFLLLYLSAWSVGSLCFQFVNRAYPDPAMGSRGISSEGIRWALAILMIAFPGYFVLARNAYRSARRDPERRQSRVRKWLTNLTLFVAASVLLGDLITVLFSFLDGELTTRFVLKSGVVAAIAGAVFGYYLWDLRQDDLDPKLIKPTHPGLRIFAGLAAGAVVATISGAFFVAGSPGTARSEQIDARRLTHLQLLSRQIDRYRNQHGELPEDLLTLARTREYGGQSTRDPETGELYLYSVTGDRTYRLCATFDVRSDPGGGDVFNPYAGDRDQTFWFHEAGEHCYDLEVIEPATPLLPPQIKQ